jgi:hypothetical protein
MLALRWQDLPYHARSCNYGVASTTSHNARGWVVLWIWLVRLHAVAGVCG